MANEAAPERHMCHCGKSFLRKEHLRRHQATHGERSHICPICQRSFTRNDLLRRHVSLHNSAPISSTRSWRACDACHENKTKCDGGDQCSLCMKRGIACTFERTLPGNGRDSTAANGGAGHSLVDAEMAEGIMADIETDRNAENDACCARTCLKSILKAVSVPAFNSLVCDTPPSSDELKAWMTASIQQYFGSFHERWTIVHAASFDERTDDAFVVGTVLMIGAWQRDRENLGELIVDIHGRLLQRLMSLLTAPSQKPGEDKPWPFALYQASLLQIVFAFETGIPRVIQRSRQLLSLLIVALREQGIFNPQFVSEHQTKHFPGDFKPWVFYFQEKWKLLCYSAFRVDVAISLFLNQAPLLRPEELEIGILSSYGLTNGHGIHIFFQRFKQEPTDRNSYPMFEVATNPNVSIPSGILLQDVQLGLCGLFSDIYRWGQKRRYQFAGVHPDYCRNQELEAQLETWKVQLHGICNVWKDPIANENAIKYMMHAYRGKEEPGEEGWEDKVSARISRTFFNVAMLHSLLRLYLYADLRSIFLFSLGSLDLARIMTPAVPDPDNASRLQHWAMSWKGRRAVIFSLYILKSYENAPFSLPEQTVDPTAHMAVATAALVLRCWIVNSSEHCECGGIQPGRPSAALNLELEADKEQWALEGGVVVLDGTPMCLCALRLWMSRFMTAISTRGQDWEMSRTMLHVLNQEPGLLP